MAHLPFTHSMPSFLLSVVADNHEMLGERHVFRLVVPHPVQRRFRLAHHENIESFDEFLGFIAGARDEAGIFFIELFSIHRDVEQPVADAALGRGHRREFHILEEFTQ